MKRLFSVKESAVYLGVSIRKIDQLIADNYLPVKHQGRFRFVDLADLDAYVDALPSERKSA